MPTPLNFEADRGGLQGGKFLNLFFAVQTDTKRLSIDLFAIL